MRFPDLASAGRELAPHLEKYRGDGNVLVLALVRGGVPAAIEVARHIEAPLDLVLRRTALHVGVMRSAAGVTVAGKMVLDDELHAIDPNTPQGLNAQSLLDLLERRTLICRGTKPPVDVAGKTILLIDNGVRTGDTVSSSIRGIRKLAPKEIIVGLGAASRESRDMLHDVADDVICLRWPDGPFGHVGLWYQRMDVPDDETIGRLFAAF